MYLRLFKQKYNPALKNDTNKKERVIAPLGKKELDGGVKAVTFKDKGLSVSGSCTGSWLVRTSGLSFKYLA